MNSPSGLELGWSVVRVPQWLSLPAIAAARGSSVIVKLCDESALPTEGSLKAFHGSGREICVVRTGGLFAFDNRCPHQNAPLSAGRLEGTMVVCPYHAWRFNVATGRAALHGDPPLHLFEIRQYGAEVFIALPDPPRGPSSPEAHRQQS